MGKKTPAKPSLDSELKKQKLKNINTEKNMEFKKINNDSSQIRIENLE